MAPRQASPTGLLILLSAVALPTTLAGAMLGPLLVALAHEFQTSVAVVGQLAAATAITWGIIAPPGGSGLRYLWEAAYAAHGPAAYGRRHTWLPPGKVQDSAACLEQLARRPGCTVPG